MGVSVCRIGAGGTRLQLLDWGVECIRATGFNPKGRELVAEKQLARSSPPCKPLEKGI